MGLVRDQKNILEMIDSLQQEIETLKSLQGETNGKIESLGNDLDALIRKRTNQINSRIEERSAELSKNIDETVRKRHRQTDRLLTDYLENARIRETEQEEEPYRGHLALQYCLGLKDVVSVLDVGSGGGIHSNLFDEAGFQVTAIDYGKSPLYVENPRVRQIVADFNEYPFTEQFDCVWACHVLEHQLNPNLFLKKVHALTKEGGYAAITVPPLKQTIVGGHVTLWNAGMLLYHLVLAGFDCSDAHVRTYGYNVSVIVKKRSINVLPIIAYDSGDIRLIRDYLPDGLVFHSNSVDDPFDGDIVSLNWDRKEG